MSKIQRCIKCGNPAASIIIEKTDNGDRIGIIHCHKCGYHDEIKGTEILGTEVCPPALDIPDFANSSWDKFRVQMNANA